MNVATSGILQDLTGLTEVVINLLISWDGKPDFWIGGEGKLEKPVHIAIVAKDRPTVDAFYRAALAAEGTDNGPPGLRPHYHPNYYAAFVLDPDGHNIEAVCHQPDA